MVQGADAGLVDVPGPFPLVLVGKKEIPGVAAAQEDAGLGKIGEDALEVEDIPRSVVPPSGFSLPFGLPRVGAGGEIIRGGEKLSWWVSFPLHCRISFETVSTPESSDWRRWRELSRGENFRTCGVLLLSGE